MTTLGETRKAAPSNPLLMDAVQDVDGDVDGLGSQVTRKAGGRTTLPYSSLGCGITHMYGLYGSPERIVNKVLKRRGASDRSSLEAHVIFSDTAYPTSGGTKLANYIREHKLGSLIETPATKNPNSSNPVKVWVWTPPHDMTQGIARDGHVRLFMSGIFKGHCPNESKYIEPYQRAGYEIRKD